MGKGWVVLVVAVLAGLGQAALGGQAGPGQGESPALQHLIKLALDRSAELAALREQIAAAEARVTVAGGLPDPMASAGLSNVMVGGMGLDRDPMSGLEFMLSQEVTRRFRRRLRGEVQQTEAEALRARHISTANGIVRGVKQAYIDLQYLDQALEISEQNKRLAEDVLALSESQYATGKVGQQDVFQSQVQLSRMVEALVLLRKQRAAAVTRLNRLLYQPREQPVAKLPTPSLTEFSAAPLSPDSLQQQNSVLRESLARTAQAQSQLRLAEQWRRPDYTLSFRYMIRQQMEGDPMSGADMWSASVGISLPWVNRGVHEAEARAARADQTGVEQSTAAQINDITARLVELAVEIERAEEQLSLVETGLLPQAEGALAASRSAYTTGKTDVINVLSNQLSLYNLLLERAQLLREHEQNVAEYEYELNGALAPQAMGMAPIAPVSAMPAGAAMPAAATGAMPRMGSAMPAQKGGAAMGGM
jgi:outer membrane protein TolC